jgi:hypothetical protein
MTSNDTDYVHYDHHLRSTTMPGIPLVSNDTSHVGQNLHQVVSADENTTILCHVPIILRWTEKGNDDNDVDVSNEAHGGSAAALLASSIDRRNASKWGPWTYRSCSVSIHQAKSLSIKGTEWITGIARLWPILQRVMLVLLVLLAKLQQADGLACTRIRHHYTCTKLHGGSSKKHHRHSLPTFWTHTRSSSQTIILHSTSSSPDHADITQHTTTAAQDTILERLAEWFQGDFDNYPQVVEDRRQNMEPREGGGHEHFHCTLVPLSRTSRLAAFFFDGNPERIFRFRHYQLIVTDEDRNASTTSVEMQLSTLHPDLETILRSKSKDPVSWPSLFHEFEPSNPTDNKVTLLPKCEIEWSLEKDPKQHAYIMDIPENDDTHGSSSSSLHAVMVHGEAIVNSTIVPGMAIRILDQLSLYEHVFYINDRGFDPNTGAFIYGNQRGVPYRLDQVARFVPALMSPTEAAVPTNKLQRHVTNLDLEWTMGPEWRTEEEYRTKMNVIGGVSAGINKKGYKSKMSKIMVENDKD